MSLFPSYNLFGVIDKPLTHFLQKMDASKKMVKWAKELCELRIKFMSKTTLKGQVLANL